MWTGGRSKSPIGVTKWDDTPVWPVTGSFLSDDRKKSHVGLPEFKASQISCVSSDGTHRRKLNPGSCAVFECYRSNLSEKAGEASTHHIRFV
jgi:hypothetical protein